LRKTRCGRGRRPQAAGFPALIPFSRMHVAAHYLSDVVRGAIVGAPAAFIAAIFLLPQIRTPKSKIEIELAEGVGFEPTRACALPVFKTGAINRSTTPPVRC
jgi:membrane-associated phospholipid phosphatase